MDDRIIYTNNKPMDSPSVSSSPFMFRSGNEDDHHHAAEFQQEFPAARVRSGISELEQQTTQVLHRLENLKCSTEPNALATPAASILVSEQKPTNEIFKCLEALISHTDSSDDEDHFPLPPLDDVAHLAIMTHSLVAYMSHLDYHKLSKITQKICNETARWLADLFAFPDASASYHTDSTGSLLRSVRLAIIDRCPGYLDGGLAALVQPCLYISDQSAQLGLQYVCRQLGLPLASIRLVPSVVTYGSFGSMDDVALQKMIAQDVASGRTPLFLVADVGSSLCGNVDNVAQLREVCRANSVWLHCRGNTLAALAAAVDNGGAKSAGGAAGGEAKSIADSLSLSLGGWLGLPNLPVALLHRPISNLLLSAFDLDPVLTRRLRAISLWTTLQGLGRNAIADRLISAFESCRHLYNAVSVFDDIKILSKAPGGNNNLSFAELENRSPNYPFLFQASAPLVIFQFDGHSAQRAADLKLAASAAHGSQSSIETHKNDNETENNDSSDLNQSLIQKSIEMVANNSYFDKLNSWLGQNLQRDCQEVELEIVDLPGHGTCLRFCPFEMALGQTVPQQEHVERFAECLDSQLEVLRATVKHRGSMNRLVAKSEVLRLVPLTDWAGLGGVRFVPESWENLLTDQAKSELNKLNLDLVEALRATDNAFSMGEGADGLYCVRFGMVTDDTDVEELMDLVVSIGRKVQENSKALDTMSEIVKKGIQTATADLQRETDEKMWSDGILRHVPVFGQVVNWWSPPVKETGIKGRSLNLTQGVVESTENIYKYHMQISRNNTSPKPGSKNPPSPIVQTSVSTSHSRNTSKGSVTASSLPPNVVDLASDTTATMPADSTVGQSS